MKKFLLSIALMVSATMCWAVSQEVECTPGNLANLVTNYNVTSLTITGQMDARDFKFISDNLDALTSIDLSGVSIVPYSNTSSPLFSSIRRLQATCKHRSARGHRLDCFIRLLKFGCRPYHYPNHPQVVGDGCFCSLPSTAEC